MGGNGANPISYSRFLGLANRGFAVYDSTDQLPGPYQLAGDYKSPEFFDTAIGVGLAGSIRSGINLDLTARAGSARLAVKDNISLSWTRRNGAITLSSDYSYKPSAMKVNGPKLSALIDGRTDTTLAAYLNYKPPSASDWKKTGNLLGSSYNYSIPFYSRGFSSESSSTLASFGSDSSLEFQGINLDSESSTQITRGVSSRVEDPLLRATLDLDQILASSLSLPTGLSYEISQELGPISVDTKLSLADLALSFQASIRQVIDAQVDNITGLLRMENGTTIQHVVGTTTRIPIADYDANKDGRLDITATFAKQGFMTNKTDLVTSLSFDADFLTAKLSAAVDLGPLGKPQGSFDIGPLLDPAPWNLANKDFSIFNQR